MHEVLDRRSALVHDTCNACLGVMNAVFQVANAIELGQIQAGLIVSSESARQIVDQHADFIG